MTRTMTRRGWTAAAVLLALAGLAGGVQAQTDTAGGEVTKLDKPGNRITLKHGEIKNLDMPPMTMSFRVRDAKLLDGVAVGDRVRFAAERIDGQYTVTALTKAP
jgi:Cu(I)/Ag(I) efflux system periplasmic protein CusF